MVRHDIVAGTRMTDSIEEKLKAVAELLDRLRREDADISLRELLRVASHESLLPLEPQLRAITDRFLKKRKRDLTALLDSYLAVARSRAAAPTRRSSPSVGQLAPMSRPAPMESNRREYSDRTKAILNRNECRTSLDDLARYHIFQWSNFYRPLISDFFDRATRTSADDRAAVLLILSEELARHTADIYERGFRHTMGRLRGAMEERDAIAEATAKCMNGLHWFLSLPIEAYGDYALEIETAEAARVNRAVCSAMLGGIIEGFGGAHLDGEVGWSLLARFVRSWGHFLAFIKREPVLRIAKQITTPEFRSGLETTVAPVLGAIDEFMARQEGADFTLPRIGQFNWDGRRLEISISLPKSVEKRRYLEVHCYLISAYATRRHLEESINRGINLIAVPLRPDLLDWALAQDLLRTNLADTSEQTSDQVVTRARDILNHELARFMGPAGVSEPITVNLAKGFPLNNPFLNRYFIVQRRSVRNLLKTLEQETGVRLWCSVRRSGKTTACFDLGAAASGSVLINQTMDHTDQYPGANVFYQRFARAIESGRQLPSKFFHNAVLDCRQEQPIESERLIFVLDEYETLFERMKAAVNRDREVRYTVVQPLLNQMVAFSRDNLIIFIGQRPDSHFIIMDQNQLSPYVKQDAFPLFEHAAGSVTSEFAELVRKVLTERVNLDGGFVDSLFAETAGHVFLTVNTLVYFYQWLIDRGRRANELDLSSDDFQRFRTERLTPTAMSKSLEFEVFENIIGEALASREHAPWLFAVYSVIKRIAMENQATLACSESGFAELAREVTEQFGWDPARLLKTASMSNFLSCAAGMVRPAIPIMARVAIYTRPKLA